MADSGHVYIEPQAAALRNLAPLLAAGISFTGKRVLDAGCGTGAYSRLMLELGARDVVAVDREAANIRLAECRNGMNGISFRCAELESFAADDQFDFIFARGLIYYVRDPASTIAHFADLLFPGGELFMTFVPPTPQSRALNLLKRAASGLPNTWRPGVRRILAWLYLRSPWADREGEDQWEIVRDKMNTLFFPCRHLHRLEEAECLLEQQGLVVRHLVANQGHRCWGMDFGIWAQLPPLPPEEKRS